MNGETASERLKRHLKELREAIASLGVAGLNVNGYDVLSEVGGAMTLVSCALQNVEASALALGADGDVKFYDTIDQLRKMYSLFPLDYGTMLNRAFEGVMASMRDEFKKILDKAAKPVEA